MYYVVSISYIFEPKNLNLKRSRATKSIEQYSEMTYVVS